ncbi:CRTAC1 family protein [Pseudomarimonas arenosa]|uniref:VCBS repeat-containing protein n=1 Tax=Pseudomarimonas arenosa TaxID=2774145 RepID=A0AAW3ZNJ2_9GAMM|nr:CRTAC1 family protein [Pseudomarimonas arenosa]MBD8526495.1 VCBS repeat-containing protein [Pseudomarimonas arenosa]
MSVMGRWAGAFRWTLMLSLTLFLLGCRPAAEIDVSAIADNNRAVGLMGQYRNEEARQIFAELVERYPEQQTLATNLAIALLNRQTEGDEEAALQVARGVLQRAPDHLPARYVAGLAELYLGRVEQALPELLVVSDADPSDSHAAYFAAQSLAQTGREAEALQRYQQAIEADPYLRSAYYAAALLQRKAGEAEAAKTLLADYQRLAANPRAHLAEFRYTRMGRKAEARVLGAAQAESQAPRLPEGELFAAAERVAEVNDAPSNPVLNTADLDQDGRQDLLLFGVGKSRVWRGVADGFQAWDEHPLAALDQVRAAGFADLDNDGQLDAVLCTEHGLQWWRLGATQESLQTAAGLDEAAGCDDLNLLDADHDGDLDLLLRGGSSANHGSTLLNNNLNGSFRALDEFADVVPSTGHRQWLTADVDADRDLDLLVLGEQAPPLLLRNDRLWAWQAVELPVQWPGNWQAATLADLDATGLPSLYAVDDQSRLWQATPGNGQLSELGKLELSTANAHLLAQDFDGDGRAELLVWSGAGIEVLSVEGEALRPRWRYAGSVKALQPVLQAPAAGPALLALVEQEQGLALLRFAPGSGRFPFIALQPSGRSHEADGMRSNVSGIGTQVRLRYGGQWSIVDSLDRHSSVGQSLQPLSIGLGGARLADFIEFGWSDGVMQTELALAAGELHVVAEQQRQLASCPVLFAWNGQRYEFISDLLGVGGIGFLLSPGQYAESRPWEFFQLPPGSAQAREGQYLLKIAEPMEEVAYLDQVRLHVYDLPPGWQMTLDERMHTGGGPAPTGAPIFFTDAGLIPTAGMRDRFGQDIGPMLAHNDALPLDPGALDPRFLGRLAEPMSIELELGQAFGDGDDLWLLGDGWVEYPYSQTLFAAWQAGASYQSFSLDAQRQGSDWHPVYEQFGYPAGMPRGFALPLTEGLGADQAQVRRLRLRGNLEVYLDRLRLVRASAPPAELRQQAISVKQAQVRRVGYPRRSSLPFKRPHFDYQQRSPFWDTRYPEGHYTAFGDATELVLDLDDGFAIIGPGDEIQLAFDAPESPPAGWQRVLVLEVRGYAKDMDLYTRGGERVEPLPITAGLNSAAGRDLARAHNTRFQQGR